MNKLDLRRLSFHRMQQVEQALLSLLNLIEELNLIQQRFWHNKVLKLKSL